MQNYAVIVAAHAHLFKVVAFSELLRFIIGQFLGAIALHRGYFSIVQNLSQAAELHYISKRKCIINAVGDQQRAKNFKIIHSLEPHF